MTHSAKSGLLFCVCLMLATSLCLAQSSAGEGRPATAALPAWAVLVLKPVGTDRVRPITGVVVSEQGLVLVPLDFAAPGDQIIVLDGGTDIVVNGRAATIRQQMPEAGLALLSAPALSRRPASLPLAPLADGDEVRLAAFPPAELIAQGAAPVSEVTQVSISQSLAEDGGKAMVVETAKALPNVTGPLLDRCGNLAGFSSADGVQSMDTTRAPTYLWTDDLLRLSQRLQLEMIQAPCPASALAAAEESKSPAETANPQADTTVPAAEDGQAAGAADTALPKSLEGPSPSVRQGGWLLWPGLMALVVLTGMAWRVFRRRKISSPGSESPGSARATAAEPGPTAPGSNSRPEQTDCVLEISGRLPDGAPFISSCDVNGAAINVVIGRGRADISIDSKDVHREHARLSGSAEMLTISDLGSARGTWINRVPCLKGEIMFIGADDTIFLGDVSFQVVVRPRQDHGGNN